MKYTTYSHQKNFLARRTIYRAVLYMGSATPEQVHDAINLENGIVPFSSDEIVSLKKVKSNMATMENKDGLLRTVRSGGGVRVYEIDYVSHYYMRGTI